MEKAEVKAAALANVRLMLEGLERLQHREGHLPGLGVYFGPSGLGKTVSATVAVARRRGYYVVCRSSWTRRAFLVALLAEMGISKPPATVYEMTELAGQQLSRSGRPLLIDEADAIIDRGAIEVVRDVYEVSLSPIILIGEELIARKLERFERVHNRVLEWMPASFATLADCRALAAMYCPKLEIADDLLDLLRERCGGRVRRICVNLSKIAAEAAAARQRAVSRGWWGDRPLYTGEAPMRRVA